MIKQFAIVAAFISLGTPAAIGESPADQAAAVRDDGFLTVAGEPWFPLGIYHDSLDTGYYGAKLIRDVEIIADAGFNCAALSVDFTWDGDGPASSTAGKIARLAVRREMRLFLSVYLPELELFAREHARWPGVLISSIGSDFNTDEEGRLNGPPKLPPDKLRALHQRVKRVAPAQLTYTSGLAHPGAKLQGYTGAVDCVGIQCYPFGDGSQRRRAELEATDDILDNYWRLAGADANRALIANLQAFAWEGERVPSPEDVRAQAWLALLGGAKGILWYSFLSHEDKRPLPEAHPNVWGELQLLTPEIKQCLPYVTGGEFHRFENPDNPHFADKGGTWHAAIWQRGEERLLVVANTHRSRSQTVEVDITAGDNRKWRPLFADGRYGRSLKFAGGRIRGTIAPATVEVWRMQP